MFNFDKPSFGFIGVGALGGYYSTRLELSGQEVHYLLRQDFPIIKSQGFEVTSTQGNYKLNPKNIYKEEHHHGIVPIDTSY